MSSRLKILWLAAAAFVAGACWCALRAQEPAHRAQVDFVADALDGSRSNPAAYTSGELKLVAKGGTASAAALIKLTLTPVVGPNVVDVTAQVEGLGAGEWDAWVRLRNAKGWGAWAGPIRFTVPLSGPQAAQPVIPPTTPIKAAGLKARVVEPEPPPPPPPPPAVTATLFGDADRPAFEQVSDVGSFELGVRFRATVPGKVRGIRFWKGPLNTGAHTVSLWDPATGARLATTVVAETTVSGWQSADFAAPVPISADTLYLATYWCPVGHFAVTHDAFRQEKRSGFLVAPASTAAAPNGTYRVGSSELPDRTYRESNYWVDPVCEFAVASEPPPRPAVRLAWDAPTLNADGSPLQDLAGFALTWCRDETPGDVVREVLGLVTEWQAALMPGGYQFTVLARDASGNESEAGWPLAVRIE